MKSIEMWCSNCGRHTTIKRPVVSDAQRLYEAGYRAVGNALYCPDCVKTWAERNGRKFDEKYRDPHGMWMRWCDNNFR